MSTLHAEIITPAGKVYEGDVHMVCVRSAEGDLGILPRHMPIVVPLKIAMARLKHEDEKIVDYAAIHGGFIQVNRKGVTIISQAAEMKEDIDIARAKKAEAEAKAKLDRLHKTSEGYEETRAKLQRAQLRIATAEAGEDQKQAVR
ncbi:MAG: ATP synthase F1 subunit epsilon [Sporolactobacillus sp.]|jgi:F-type H+-transporting ATPase subunit epsilon|nr:ATP synthase F1 subunit epsilon [Sporolactobacillus sp.]MCI1881129.1 ATP synthase F1 subunit epsilon [Sporolactobacillus sp.]